MQSQFESLDETPQEIEEDRNPSPVKPDNSTHQFLEQKDRYKGDIDPVTKLRAGTGTYTYTNPFFQYQGEWVDGKKHGRGVLLMKDGSRFVGQFV